MKAPIFFLTASFITLFLGCETATVSRAPLTAGVIQTGAHMQVDEPTLRAGRRLFVSRCIECHTLPVAWYYADAEWPKIIQSMSHRASLKPADREALLSYIRVIRAQ